MKYTLDFLAVSQLFMCVSKPETGLFRCPLFQTTTAGTVPIMNL